jgi:sugar-phosphatase
MRLSYDAVCFDLFGTLVTGEGTAIDGAREALDALPSERWAIVTSCGTSFALALISAAGLRLPRILVSADDVTRGKPAAEPYLVAAARLGVSPKRTLVVEDSRDGIDAGCAAGMDVIAIARGRGVAFAGGAIAHVDRFAELRWLAEDTGNVVVEV